MVSAVSYHVAPKFADSAAAQAFGRTLLTTLSGGDSQLASLLAAEVGESISLLTSIVSEDFSVSEAFSRVAAGILQQLVDVFERMRPQMLAGTRSLEFGGWTLRLSADITAASPIAVDVVGSVLLGDLISDVDGLPEALAAAVEPVRAATLHNVSAVVNTAPATAVELSATVSVLGTSTPWRITAFRNDDGGWEFDMVLGFAALWEALEMALGDTLGQHLERLRVPELGAVMLSTAGSRRRRAQASGDQLASLTDNFIFKIGTLQSSVDGLTTLQDALLAASGFGDGDLATAAAALMQNELDTRLQEGLCGTVEYQGRLLALSLASANDEGVRIGATMTGPPLTLREALGAAESAFEAYFAQSPDALAALTQSALEPVLDLSFAEVSLAAKTFPPSLELRSEINWLGTAAEFELSLSKNASQPWSYALMVAWKDLEPLISRLRDYVDVPTIEGSAAIMVSSATVPRVRVGQWSDRGFEQVDVALPPLDLEALGLGGATSLTLQNIATGSLQELGVAGAGGGDMDPAELTALYSQAQTLAAEPLKSAEAYARSRMQEGCAGSLQFQGVTLDVYVKASAEAGFIFGGATRGDPISVGAALGAVMGQMQGQMQQTDASGIQAAVPGNLQALNDVEIQDFAVTGRTDPPSLHASGVVTLGGTASNFEFSVTKNASGWQWGFVNEWDDAAEIARLIVADDYVSGVSLGPLALMISSESDPRVRIGQLPGGRRRRLQLSAPNAAQAVLESRQLPSLVQDFVRERLQEGVSGSCTFAGLPLNYHVASTKAGMHLAGSTAYAAGSGPTLGAAMGSSAEFDTSAVPTDYGNKIDAFLSDGPAIESASVEIWTNPAHVDLSGVVSIGESQVRFSFVAHEGAAGWRFDLAAQTDFLTEMWASLPAENLEYVGIDASWSPIQLSDDLGALAIHIEHSPTETNFELGTLSPAGQIEAFDLAKLPTLVPDDFEAAITIRNIPAGGHTIDAVIHASNDLLYLSVAKPETGSETLSTLVRAESGEDLAAQTSNAPPQLATFSNALSSARLHHMETHVWTDWGQSAVARMAGEASVLNEPIHFGLEVFSGNQAGEAMEWELTVGFDVFGFCQDNLQEVEFLSLDRRRFLQDESQGVLSVRDVDGVSELTVGRTAIDGVRGALPEELWPELSGNAMSRSTLMPLQFNMGSIPVEVFIRGVSDESGASLLVSIGLKQIVLWDVVRETVGLGLCPFEADASPSMFCQLMHVLLDAEIDEINLAAFLSNSETALAPLILRLEVLGLRIFSMPAADLMFSAMVHPDAGAMFGFKVSWTDELSFGGMLRAIPSLQVGGSHVCDLAPFEPFCTLGISDAKLAYVSHTEICGDILNVSYLAGCAPGLYFVSNMEFPPSFSIGSFTTEKLQEIAEGLLGSRLPELNIPLTLPASADMRSLRMKLAMNVIMTMASASAAGGRRAQEVQEIPEFTVPGLTNGLDLPLLTLRDFSFMMDASPSGFAPGFEGTLHLDMRGAAEASGRRMLRAMGDSFHSAPFWPQRRLQQASGPVPAVVDVTAGMLAGMKACGPFVEIDVVIDPALTWVNPFGIEDLRLTLQGFSGGVCFAGVPVPSRLGLMGGFSWGSFLSGMIFVELEMSATASQFLYTELRCALEPCTLESLLDQIAGSDSRESLDSVRPYIPSMGVECGDPSCRMSINTVNGIMPGASRTINDLAYPGPGRREITVPGGLMVDMPGFHFLGMSGYAAINIGQSSGFLHAGFRGPLIPPIPALSWLTLGLDLPGFENRMDMVYSPAGVNIAIATEISWGESVIQANLTLEADPLPAFGLALFVNLPIPATDSCVFNFVVEASAAMVPDSGSGVGFGGDFSFGQTGLDSTVLSCMVSEMRGTLNTFWTDTLADWVGSASGFLNNARGAAAEAIYDNNKGFCRKTTRFRSCNPGECVSDDTNPCAGRCYCDEAETPDTCRCACPDSPDDCINPGDIEPGDGADKLAACRAQCATEEGRQASLRGNDGGRRRRVQVEETDARHWGDILGARNGSAPVNATACGLFQLCTS